MKNVKKVYIVVEPGDIPKLLGVYKTRESAEKEAYKDSKAWRNVIEKKLRE